MLGKLHWCLAEWFARRARYHTKKARKCQAKYEEHMQLSFEDWDV